MKLKALVLATAVVAASFSGSASALDIQGVDVSGQARNGDLVLTIYDTARDVSFVQDLGTNFSTIVAQAQAGTFSGSYNLDASALSVFAASANKNNLLWTLSSAAKDDLNVQNSGLIMTTNSTAALRDDPNVALDDTGLSIAGAKFGDLASAAKYNTIPAGTPGVATTGVAGSALSAEVNAYGQRDVFSFSFENAAKANVAQNLYFWGEDADGLAVASTKASANAWVLDLSNLSSATLKSAPAVTANTPLPAAAWLMFSALMGLGGIARRRNNV